MAKTFRVKLIKGMRGCSKTQRATVRCIGLRRTNSEVVVADTPAMRGQILKVQHLIEVDVVGASEGAGNNLGASQYATKQPRKK